MQLEIGLLHVIVLDIDLSNLITSFIESGLLWIASIVPQLFFTRRYTKCIHTIQIA